MTRLSLRTAAAFAVALGGLAGELRAGVDVDFTNTALGEIVDYANSALIFSQSESAKDGRYLAVVTDISGTGLAAESYRLFFDGVSTATAYGSAYSYSALATTTSTLAFDLPSKVRGTMTVRFDGVTLAQKVSYSSVAGVIRRNGTLFDSASAYSTDVTVYGPVNPGEQSLAYSRTFDWRGGDVFAIWNEAFAIAHGPISGLGIVNSAAGSYISTTIRYSITAIPEPSNWAMLIAGFGLIGAAIRRQRAVRLA